MYCLNSNGLVDDAEITEVPVKVKITLNLKYGWGKFKNSKALIHIIEPSYLVLNHHAPIPSPI